MFSVVKTKEKWLYKDKRWMKLKKRKQQVLTNTCQLQEQK